MNPTDRPVSYSAETGSNADDVALIRRMVDVDESALGALYDRWVTSLYSLALKLLGDSDEAEDVVEETFWQAWRKAGSYEPSRGAVSTWLLTIGRRKALDRLRSRKRRREDSLDDDRSLLDAPSPSADPHADAAATETRAAIRAALRDLPPEQRQVLELGYFQGMSQSEIADATGQPIGTVKTRTRLALQKLREPLSAHRGSGK